MIKLFSPSFKSRNNRSTMLRLTILTLSLTKSLLIKARFDVVPKPIAPPKISDFKRCLLHFHNYIKRCKECKFKLLNLADTIFGATTIISTVKAEM